MTSNLHFPEDVPITDHQIGYAARIYTRWMRQRSEEIKQEKEAYEQAQRAKGEPMNVQVLIRVDRELKGTIIRLKNFEAFFDLVIDQYRNELPENWEAIKAEEKPGMWADA